MPNILITLPNVTQSVTRPIVTDIVTQVKHNLAITPEAETFFFSDDGQALTAGSKIGEQDRNARFASQRMVMLEVEQTVNMDNLATSVSNREEHIPIFEDPRLGVIVRPVYESRDIRLTFKYRTTSKQEAQRWKDDISMRVSTMREMFMHTISYHYGLPKQVWDLLAEVYDKRQTLAGYDQSFEQYIHECTRGRLTMVAEGTGQFRLPVVPESQMRIVGLFDFTPLPEKAEYEDELGTHMVTFSYKFTYDCPIGCNLVYPIMVHNQYLSQEFIEFGGPAPYNEERKKSFSQSFHAFRHFETEPVMNDLKPIHPYIRIPEIDDFTPRSATAGTGTVLLTLLQFETEHDKLLLNLGQLGDVEIHEEILRFIREIEYPWMNKPYKSIFNVALYEGDRLYAGPSLMVTDGLDIITTRPINLRQCYHFRLSIVTDLTLLDKAALERLKIYPCVFVQYFQALNRLLKTRPDFIDIGKQARVTKGQADFLWWVVSGGGKNGVPDWVSRNYVPPSWGLKQPVSFVPNTSGGYGPGGYPIRAPGQGGIYPNKPSTGNEYKGSGGGGYYTGPSGYFDDPEWHAIAHFARASLPKTVEITDIIAFRNQQY